MQPNKSPPSSRVDRERSTLTASDSITDEELRCQALFLSANFSTIAPLLRDCNITVLVKDDILITAGQPNEYLYLLLSGRLSVHLASSETVPVTEITAGDSVGELSLIDGQPASAYVIAETDCRVLAIDEQLLWILVESSHAISSNLLFTLTKRLRYGNQMIFEGREKIKQYQFHATVDALTGLFNRHWLNAMLPRQIHRSCMCSQPFCLMFADIDNFKQYNDEHGHVAGDCAIGAVAEVLQNCLRPTDMAARYGGEEFIVLLPNCPLDAAKNAAERVRSAVEMQKIAFAQGTQLPSVTVSVGIAQMSEDDSLESLVAAADTAMYRAKKAGRNRVAI